MTRNEAAEMRLDQTRKDEEAAALQAVGVGSGQAEE